MAAVCTLPVEPADLPIERFFSRYVRPGRPVVIRNATRIRPALRASSDEPCMLTVDMNTLGLTTSLLHFSGRHFRQLTEPGNLMRMWGTRNVTLSSANAFSFGRKRMSIADYIISMEELSWDGEGSENADAIYYWFGEHGPELEELLAQVSAGLTIRSLTLRALLTTAAYLGSIYCHALPRARRKTWKLVFRQPSPHRRVTS